MKTGVGGIIPETKQLPVVMPKDLMHKMDYTILFEGKQKLEKVKLHEFPIIVGFSFWEKTGFFVKKVLPYLYTVARFYSPIPLPNLQFHREEPMNLSDWLKQKSPVIFAILLVVAGVASDPHIMDLLPEWASRLLTVLGTVVALFTKPIQTPTQLPKE